MFAPPTPEDSPATSPVAVGKGSSSTWGDSSSAWGDSSEPLSPPYSPQERRQRNSGEFSQNFDLDFNAGAREEEAGLVELLCSGFPEYMEENPSLVSFMALVMLRFRDNDMASAKERLGNYLKWRKEMFGNLDEHYLHNDPVLRQQLSSGFLHVFVDKNMHKPALMYAAMKLHIPRTYSAAQTMKCWHFLIFASLRQNLNILRSGFIVLQNLEGCGLGNSDSKIPEHINHAVQNVMPIRVLRVIFYKSPIVLNYLFKFVKFVFSRKIRDRMVVTTNEGSLTKKYGVNPELLPVELGGEMVVPTVDNGLLEGSPLLGADVYV
jgi:hypothetical protein